MDKLKTLVDLVAYLRGPQGCPWDQAQTHDSLKPYLMEESSEVLEAIDQKNDENLKEELGDVLLHILLHAQLATERQAFGLGDVLQGLEDKLIRRHPHVFGDRKGTVHTPDEALAQWQAMKALE